MAKRKNPDDQPTPAPEPEPTPAGPEVEPTAPAEPTPPDAPAAGASAPDPGPSFEERLAALEKVLAEKDGVIALQAIELGQAAENADLLEKSRHKVRRLKDRHVDAKEEAAAAKKAYDAALEDHLDLERDLLTGQGRLPFPSPDAAPTPAPAPSAAGAGGPVATAILPSVDGEAAGDASWRQVPLGTLGVADELPHAILARLEDAGIATVGDLADFVRPAPSGYCKRLVDIDGIGESKAAKIEAALDAFWKNWSAWQARTAAEAAAPALGEDPIDVEFEEADDPAPFDPPADYEPGADDDDDQDDDGGA